MSVNKVILIGNLTRDPELKTLPSGTPVAEFGLATNRKFKGQDGADREEVCFVDCSAFGKTAENIHKYFEKGKGIYVEGRLKWDSWEDKNGGGKRSKLSVIADTFSFLPGGRRDDDGGGDGGPDRWTERQPESPRGEAGRRQYEERQPPPQRQRQEPRNTTAAGEHPHQAATQQRQQPRREQPQPHPADEQNSYGGFYPEGDLGPELESRR